MVMTAVIQRTLADRRLTAARVTRAPRNVKGWARARDSRQTSFSTEFLDAYSEDTAKAARELEALRKLFL